MMNNVKNDIPYADIVLEASKKHGVEPSLVMAVIRQESNFNPKAKSFLGAKGLMQLMPDTAKELGITDPYDPYQNILGGVKYIAQLLKMFDGNIDLALSAYNVGVDNVKKHGSIPPFKETQNYVEKVKQYLSYYRTLLQ